MATTPDRPAAATVLAEAEAELQAWVAAHPAATLYALEMATERQLARVRAAVAVVATATADPAPARPVCPDCGTPMQHAGRQERTVLLPHDEALTLQGPRFRCPACGTGLFPPGGAA